MVEKKPLSTQLLSAAATGALFGSVTGTIENSFQESVWESKMSVKAVTVKALTNIAAQAALFAGVATTYVTVSAAAENVRGKDDYVNRMAGACAAGSLIGLKKGQPTLIIGACPMMAFASAVMDLSGLTFSQPEEVRNRYNPTLARVPPQTPH